MKNLLRALLAVLFLPAALPAADVPPTRYKGATPLEWSRRMADSEIARRGESMFPGGGPRARWDYTTTLFGLSLLKLADRTSHQAYAEYGARTAEAFLQPDGTIATYRMGEFNIDMIAPGKVLLHRWEQGQRDEKQRRGIATMIEQMEKHPRTSEGGYWHKLRYPHQMWLDGLYMASPFLAHYGKVFEDPARFDDVANQILLMDKHAYDPKSGLYHHAWDERRAQPWADPRTGRSPNFWSRAIGWYGMALVDSLDFFPPTHPEVERINEVLRRVADGVVRHQDPATGLWWQVTDQANREGNYLESTASAMFVYTLAKGINRGYLPRGKYEAVALRGYAGIIRDFIRPEGDTGRISLTRCCEVAGLGYTNSKGRARDGSFEYYISEPIVDNDLKGVGPFILAGIEMQQLLTVKEPPIAVRGWGDYERILARIRAPTFPDRDFPITQFGAQPGVDCTAAIAAAIAACHGAGGGRVVVPAGEWLTGAIHLKSNVNLHVSKGATVRFSTDPADYPLVFTRWEGMEMMGLSPLIYAFGQENIAITGQGTLDGQGSRTTWWPWKGRPGDGWEPGMDSQIAARQELFRMAEAGVPPEQRVFGRGSGLRPQFIQPYRSRNVLIEGVTVRNSPMWHLHPVLCENVIIRGVSVIGHGPNNDGCNPESSRDVLIEDTLFDTGDDCIAIKSGRNNDGRRLNVPSENIIVRDCVMKDGHGGVVLGSECSGGIRNVFIENCGMDSPELERALRFKNNAVRGGVLENVFMRNVRIGRVAEAVVTIDLLYEEGARGDHQPVVRNVQLENITSSASPRVLFIRGFEGALIDNIRISNSTFNGVTATEVVEHAGTLTLQNVSISPAASVRSRSSVGQPAEGKTEGLKD